MNINSRTTVMYNGKTIYPFSQIKKKAGNNNVKKVIKSDKVYKPVGPYSPAVLVGNRLTIAGLIGMSKDGVMAKGVVAETKQILEHLDNTLAEAGITKHNLVHARVYMTDLSKFGEFNKVYGDHLKGIIPPTRECVQVPRLPKDASIEIFFEAHVPSKDPIISL